MKRSHEAELFLSTIALGEFAERFDRAEQPIVATVREGHTLVPPDDQTAVVDARATSPRELIGINHLWIGCASLRLGIPVVTANAASCGRPRCRLGSTQ
jgi:tRNA(fMet)-specific endonuclease VapC